MRANKTKNKKKNNIRETSWNIDDDQHYLINCINQQPTKMECFRMKRWKYFVEMIMFYTRKELRARFNIWKFERQPNVS